MKAVDQSSAEHYVWGDACDGWHLLQQADLSVIRERVPAGASEVMHVHDRARQFFWIISGIATMAFADQQVTLNAGQGLHVPPGVPHRFCNHGDSAVEFLVISSPSTRGDRCDLDPRDLPEGATTAAD